MRFGVFLGSRVSQPQDTNPEETWPPSTQIYLFLTFFKVTLGPKIIYSELHITWAIKSHSPIRNPITCAWLKPLLQQASAHHLKLSEEEESTPFIGILSQHLIIPTVKALGLILK